MSQARKKAVIELMGMRETNLLDSYLGVPLFKVRARKIHVWGITKKLQAKLAGWKASILSLQERVVLIKSVLLNLPIYNMSIYKCCSEVFKKGDQIIRNFLRSGETEQRKGVVVKWDKVCKPLSEGGLGLRRLKDINKIILMKLMSRLVNPLNKRADFIVPKYTDKASK